VFSINNHRQQHSEVPYTRSPCSWNIYRFERDYEIITLDHF